MFPLMQGLLTRLSSLEMMRTDVQDVVESKFVEIEEIFHTDLIGFSMRSKCSPELRPTTENVSTVASASDLWTVSWLATVPTKISTAGF